MYEWLIVVGILNSSKRTNQLAQQTDRQAKASNTIERFDYVFNGGVDEYKLTDLWLFADSNSKVSICAHCHQTLNRGNRSVSTYICTLIFTIQPAMLLAMYWAHRAHSAIDRHCSACVLCRWIKFEQLFSSTWWIHFHLILFCRFFCILLTAMPNDSLTRCVCVCNGSGYMRSMVQSLNVNGKCGDAAEPPNRPRPNCMQKDNRSENVNNWCRSKRWSANTTIEMKLWNQNGTEKKTHNAKRKKTNTAISG